MQMVAIAVSQKRTREHISHVYVSQNTNSSVRKIQNVQKIVFAVATECMYVRSFVRRLRT